MRVLLLSLMMLLTGCATTSFTQEKIDKLRIGMPATEVREMFGPANEVRTAVCGGATATGQWICETWTYRDSSTYRSSNFTFSVKQDEKTLNSWDVKR
jgi:hypothetical protein